MARKRLNSDSSSDSDEPGTSTMTSRSSGRARVYKVTKNIRGESQLHVACIGGDLKSVELLLRKGHPTNVQDYNGWTPLHEAANHGYAAIVEILLNNGANPNAVAAEGYTPLLDAASNGLVDVMRVLLDHGASVTDTTDEHEDVIHVLDAYIEGNRGSLDIEDMNELNSIRADILLRMRQKKFPHTERPFLVEEQERLDRNNQSASRSTESVTTNNGAVVYQKAIRTVRDSAIHRTVRSPREKPKAPALISEKAVVAADDDFIENDLLPRKSRKRKSTNSVASKSKQFISNRRYDESSEEESDGYEESESREENTVQQSFSGLLDAEEYESSGVVLLPDVEESSIQDATPTSSNSSRKSIRSEIFERSREVTVLTKKHSGSELQQRSSTFDGKNGEVMETVSTPPRPVGSVANFRIRVKIQDGPMLLIPIAPQYIIKDLMDAVIKRHYSRELRTPQVKLVFDEAELCDEDVISDVLQNNDTVTAEMRGWVATNPADSYRKLCETKKTKTCEDVIERLSRSAETLRLDVTDFALRGLSFESVLDSICLSSRLSEISLSGNRLAGFGSRLWGLLKAMSSVLQRLNLSQTCLDKDDLDSLVITMKNEKPSEVTTLAALTHLDLSYNPLEDESQVSLRLWLDRCPSLQSLQLISVNITGKFFEQSHLNPVAGLNSLVTFSVSQNLLNHSGIHNLLRFLPQQQLKLLDLSDTYEESLNQPSLVSELLLFALRESQPSGLAEINLSSTGLTLDNLKEFANSIRWFPSLKRLNLSRNPQLGNVGLVLTLKGLITHQSIDVLEFTHCSLEAPLDLDFFEHLTAKMESFGSKLRCLKLSFAKWKNMEAVKNDVERITECFKIAWKVSPRIESATDLDFCFTA